MRLSHFTDKPLTFDPARTYEQGRFKPRGFWLSDESDYGWAEWCADNEFADNAWRAEFEIAPTANVLTLASYREIIDFAEEYSDHRARNWYPRSELNWARVSSKWDGIMLTPYRRFYDEDAHTPMGMPVWHSAWDCSSGCFWNLSAITQVSESVAYTHERERDNE